MVLQTVSPTDAETLIARGARLIDIREPDEFARERIAGARNVPVAAIGSLETGDGQQTIFCCRSGARTQAHAAGLAAANGAAAYVLDGGIDGWRRSGRPVLTDARQPLELMRQVQLVAGGLVLIGVIGGFVLHPALFGLAGFVGAGLMTAGATGFCGMARLLRHMPWNRAMAGAAPSAPTRS